MFCEECGRVHDQIDFELQHGDPELAEYLLEEEEREAWENGWGYDGPAYLLESL